MSNPCVRYKVGDVVMIRPDLNDYTHYYDMSGIHEDIALRDMIDLAGLKMLVKFVHEDVNKYNLTFIENYGGDYYPKEHLDRREVIESRYWTDEMLEDPVCEDEFSDVPEMEDFFSEMMN